MGTVAVCQLDPGVVSGGFSASMVRMFSWTLLEHPGVIGGYQRWTGGPNIARARNTLVRWFLDAQPRQEWLLQIDSDMTFEPDLLYTLLSHADPEERPIIGGLCYAWMDDKGPLPVVYQATEDGDLVMFENFPEGLVEVAATGAACLLVHRSVFETLEEKQPDHQQPWFEEMYYRKKPIGEDLTFCVRAKLLGFPIFVDTTVDVGHMKLQKIDRRFFEDWRAARRLHVYTPHAQQLREVISRWMPCQFNKPPGDRWLVLTDDPEATDVWVTDWSVDAVREIVTAARFEGKLSDDEIRAALTEEER